MNKFMKSYIKTI